MYRTEKKERSSATMLEQLLRNLGLEDLQPTLNGEFNVSFDNYLDVNCSQKGRFVKFDGLVAVLPKKSTMRKEMLSKILRRSDRVAHLRQEILYVDHHCATIRLRRSVNTAGQAVSDVSTALQHFLAGYEGWVELLKTQLENNRSTVRHDAGFRL